MRACVFRGPGNIVVEEVPEPRIIDPTDAVIRVTHAAVCGSDLWAYRGIEPWQPGWRCGHEWLGVVEEVGAEVVNLSPGDTVLAPFRFSDGTCDRCVRGLPSSCVNGGTWGRIHPGGQAELIRCPYADATLLRIPPLADAGSGQPPTPHTLGLLAVGDVMATGHHAAVCGGVGPQTITAVVGDGAVGLCGVLAAKRLGAARIEVLGRHPERLELAKRLGADGVSLDVTPDRSIVGAADVVFECVGTDEAMERALDLVRPGGTVCAVGAPVGGREFDRMRVFRENIALRAGLTPARRYLADLSAEVIAGTLDPAPVFDAVLPLEEAAEAYRLMDAREAVKVCLTTQGGVR